MYIIIIMLFEHIAMDTSIDKIIASTLAECYLDTSDLYSKSSIIGHHVYIIGRLLSKCVRLTLMIPAPKCRPMTLKTSGKICHLS